MIQTAITVYNTLRSVVMKVYHTLKLQKHETPKGRKEIIQNIDAITLALFKQKQGIATKKSLFEIIAPRTMSRLATWSKSSKGWFYGLKLHLSVDLTGRVVAVHFTTGKASDREILKVMNRNLGGIFVADAGYLSAELEREFFIENERMLLTASRSNMKKLATETDIALLQTRMQIEDHFGNLKQFHNLISTVCRSVRGYLVNYLSSVLAYLIA